MAEGREVPWTEQMRYLPFHPNDTAAEYQQVEHPRDQDGRITPLDAEGYEAPKPYIMLDRHLDDGTHEVRRVNVPVRAMRRIQSAIDSGEMLPEHLSQLPLSELIPELADEQGRLSGAARTSYAGVASVGATDDDEEDGDAA